MSTIVAADGGGVDRRAPGLLSASGLSALSEQVYLFVAHHGRTVPHDVAQAFGLDLDVAVASLDQLLDVGLIALPEMADGAYTPVDPSIALGVLADDLDAQAAVIREQIPVLAEQFLRNTAGEQGAPRTMVLSDPGEVASWYVRVQHHARQEVLTFDRPPYVSLGMESLQVRTIDRGVHWRVVYAADSFTREEAWDETVRMAAHGEMARVAPELPCKLVVVDRSIALVGLQLDGARVDALVTESPALIGPLVEIFESHWARALPLGPDQAPPANAVTRESEPGREVPAASRARARPPTAEQRAMLAFIGAGLTDEVVAARMGLSVRSLRRRSQQLMRELNAANRFQLGVEASRRGWV